MTSRNVTVALSLTSIASLAHFWYLYTTVVPKIMEALWLTSAHQSTPTMICQTFMHLTGNHRTWCIVASVVTIALIVFVALSKNRLKQACLLCLTLGFLALAGFPHLALPGCLPYEKGLTSREPGDLEQNTLRQTYRLANRLIAFKNSQSTH